MKDGLLSIIVPVYNAEKYLGMCLDTLIAQTYSDWECLLIDDCSTDTSPDICKQYETKDSRFRYHKNENRGGVAHARNKGLELAEGEYIAFVDNDDLLHPVMYERLIGNLRALECDVSCCGYLKDFRGYDEVLREFKKEESVPEPLVFKGTEEVYYRIVCGEKDKSIEGMIWNKVYRRALLGNLRFREDVALVDDADFSLRLFRNAKKVCYIDVGLYHWMQHVTNQTTTASYEKTGSAARGYEVMIDEVSEFVHNQEILDILKKQSLSWNRWAYEKGIEEKALNDTQTRKYKEILCKYKEYWKLFDRKTQLRTWLMVNCMPGYKLYTKLVAFKRRL